MPTLIGAIWIAIAFLWLFSWQSADRDRIRALETAIAVQQHNLASLLIATGRRFDKIEAQP